MNDFDIILDEENTISIQGASTMNKKTRLVIETDEGWNLSFDGHGVKDTDEVEFNLPILAQMLVPGSYKATVEVVSEGAKFATVLDVIATAKLPLKVTSGIKTQKKYTPPAEKTVDELVAEKLLEKDQEQMEASIEHQRKELELSEGREFEVKHLRLEIKEHDMEGEFTGYGSVFDVEDLYGDVVEKGAFARTLQNYDKVKLLWQHNTMEPIGVFKEIYEDEYGLVVKGQLAMDVQRGREAYSLIQMGAIDGLSIGYSTIQAVTDKKTGIRTLKELKLYEISVVTMPANEEAVITGLKNDSSINNSITSITKDSDSIKEHSDDDSDTLHSSDDSSTDHSDAVTDVDKDDLELKTSLSKLLTTLKKDL